MNAERLLALYDRVADAPDAIARLRRFILDLAVRGRLVEQNPADEPASELLKRIAAEKARLVKAGEVRKPRAVAPPSSDALPFSLPTGWAWTQIAHLGVINPRNEAPSEQVASFVPMPMIPAEYGRRNKHKAQEWGKIKKGYTHFSEGDVGLAKITPCFENGKSTVFRNLTGGIGSGTTELHIIRPLFVNADYILVLLKSPRFIDTGISRMTGTVGQKRVPTEYFAGSPFPLPPLAEQQRIVAKVDELMALCDRLEAARAAREERRDRLTAAGLARLNALDPDAATFRAHARFAIDALPALTARAGQIARLRQTILNLAVRGRLVEQNPSDEPASKLLKRITAEKERLLKVGEIKRITVDPIASDEAPFEISTNWQWTRLGNIGDWGAGSTPSRGNPDFYGGDKTWLKSGELNDKLNLIGSEEKVTEAAITKGSFRMNWPGDVLIAMYGATIGKLAILAESAVTNQAVCGCTSFKGVFNRFLFLFLLSQREGFQGASEGGAQPNISKVKIVWTPFPLPPLAEQHRIVAKVDELMALCDRLEAGLVAADTTRQRLLESLLHEALDEAA